MLIDALPFLEAAKATRQNKFSLRAITAFVRFIEEKIGATAILDGRSVPFHKPELLDLFLIAEALKKQGVISGYHPLQPVPDEPRLFAWSARLISTTGASNTASGAHASNDRAALTATLAEALERYIWFEKTDYFPILRTATTVEMSKLSAIVPEKFAGFSTLQRTEVLQRQLLPTSKFLWTRGHSWTSGRPTWIPAQVISGRKLPLVEEAEPSILNNSTNGLATGTSQVNAVLSGALELIERDAYMIMWLNHLTLPRIDLNDLYTKHPELKLLVENCRKYNLEPTFVRMITDAPTYAVCVVLTDLSNHQPRVTLGLRAHRNIAVASEKALMEALRIRRTARGMLAHPPQDWNAEKKAGDIGHMDRLLYWMTGERSQRLNFLTQGPIQRFQEPWENDSENEHFSRIINWCKAQGYEMTSVSMTKSKSNPTPWHVEMVVIPELQPIHLHEHARHLGGARLADIPRLFGYTPLKKPYITDPHPFA